MNYSQRSSVSCFDSFGTKFNLGFYFFIKMYNYYLINFIHIRIYVYLYNVTTDNNNITNNLNYI